MSQVAAGASAILLPTHILHGPLLIFESLRSADVRIRPFGPGQDVEGIYHADEETFQDNRGYTARTLEQWSRRLNMREQNQ